MCNEAVEHVIASAIIGHQAEAGQVWFRYNTDWNSVHAW